MQTMVDGEMGCGANRTTCLHVQEGKTLAIGAQIGVLHTHTFLCSGLDQHCAGAIAEEHACLAVGIIYQ